MSQRNPEAILDIFDRMDLDDPEERRICLYAIIEYFGAIFAEVGEQLDFGSSEYDQSIRHQWDVTRTRLEKIDSVEIPDEYYQIPENISGIRGEFAHNPHDYPPADPIRSAREIAPEWADWIRDAANKYEEFQESLTATEALVQVGERALNNTPQDWGSYPTHFSDQARSLNAQADDLEEELQSFSDDDEVTKELVEVISEIFEWERDRNQFEDQFEKWEQEEAERLERLDRAENTYNFVVVDEADEYDSISVVKHQIGEPDGTYSFTISNCPISEEEMEYLRDLDADQEVRLWIGRSMYRNRNGRIDYEDIIKEVVDMDSGSATAASATDW